MQEIIYSIRGHTGTVVVARARRRAILSYAAPSVGSNPAGAHRRRLGSLASNQDPIPIMGPSAVVIGWGAGKLAAPAIPLARAPRWQRGQASGSASDCRNPVACRRASPAIGGDA